MSPEQLVSNDNIEISIDGGKEKRGLSDGIARGIYLLMRKCPHAHEMLGYKTVWEMPSSAFMVVCELFGDEVDEINKTIKKG